MSPEGYRQTDPKFEERKKLYGRRARRADAIGLAGSASVALGMATAVGTQYIEHNEDLNQIFEMFKIGGLTAASLGMWIALAGIYKGRKIRNEYSNRVMEDYIRGIHQEIDQASVHDPDGVIIEGKYTVINKEPKNKV